MLKVRITAIILLILGLTAGFFVFNTEGQDSSFPFRYGLDLDGGTSLTYRAVTTDVAPEEIEGAMDSLRKTIEKRINAFGVSEPIVSVEKGGFFSDEANENRLVVELPGVTNVSEAIDAIGKTPLLEFRLESDNLELLRLIENIDENSTQEEIDEVLKQVYEPTGLTGGLLEKATLSFGSGHQLSSEPIVLVEFNKEGSDLFAEVTRENVGRSLAIFLDGEIISNPVIRAEILGGTAQITGQFSAEEARDLVQDLNFGALPLPIDLIETQTIGSSLGHDTLNKGVNALAIAFGIIFLFLIVWYRLPGLVAVVSLAIYSAVMLLLFKLIPVTLTASGLAGFILSLGMAVDANILIFERMKEELKEGSDLRNAIIDGFKRAWLPIRDGNLSSIISAVVLFWLSSASLVKGFALVFGIGVLVSMLTAVVISRTFLLALASEKAKKSLFKVGFIRSVESVSVDVDLNE